MGGFASTSMPFCVVTMQQQQQAHAMALVLFPVKPELPKYSGIELGEVRAWRVWRLNPETFTLRSTYMESEWEPNVPMTGNHLAMGTGIHAWKTEMDAVKYMYDISTPFNVYYAIGEVDLWGEIWEHDLGYRAENAAIASIKRVFLNGKEYLEYCNYLRKKYGVEE